MCINQKVIKSVEVRSQFPYSNYFYKLFMGSGYLRNRHLTIYIWKLISISVIFGKKIIPFSGNKINSWANICMSFLIGRVLQIALTMYNL